MMPTSEPFPGETLLADGWKYIDLPRMTQKVFNEFIELVGGEGNCRWLTIARYGLTDPNATVRGQVLVSPEGVERIKRRKAELASGGPSVPNGERA